MIAAALSNLSKLAAETPLIDSKKSEYPEGGMKVCFSKGSAVRIVLAGLFVAKQLLDFAALPFTHLRNG